MKYHDVATISQTHQRLIAENMGVSKNALRTWVKNGSLPATMCGKKVLLYYPNVIAFLKSGEVHKPIETESTSPIRRIS